jgi:RNA 2',3'-cyclic 3'-phosphodiesterase
MADPPTDSAPGAGTPSDGERPPRSAPGGGSGGSASRLFIAVVPPAEVCDRIGDLHRPAVPGVRYTTPDQWHCTLRFFGAEIPERVVEAMDSLDLGDRRGFGSPTDRDAPGDHGSPAGTVEVTLGPQVTMLGGHVAVLPAGGLGGLAAAVVDATAHLGAPPDPRPFRGHLTVARLRTGADAGALVDQAFAARFTVTAIVLFASQRSAEGARYTAVASRPLPGPGRPPAGGSGLG